jgi:hypothetical protein
MVAAAGVATLGSAAVPPAAVPRAKETTEVTTPLVFLAVVVGLAAWELMELTP